MCQGTITKLTICGCELRHYTQKCTTPCKNLTGPTRYLYDTCAKCHPDQVLREINKWYDSLQWSVTAQIRQEISKEEVIALELTLESQHAARRKEIENASKVKGWNGVVDWGTQTDLD